MGLGGSWAAPTDAEVLHPAHRRVAEATRASSGSALPCWLPRADQTRSNSATSDNSRHRVNVRAHLATTPLEGGGVNLPVIYSMATARVALYRPLPSCRRNRGHTARQVVPLPAASGETSDSNTRIISHARSLTRCELVARRPSPATRQAASELSWPRELARPTRCCGSDTNCSAVLVRRSRRSPTQSGWHKAFGPGLTGCQRAVQWLRRWRSVVWKMKP